MEKTTDALLGHIADKWVSDVLRPLGFLNDNSTSLPSEDECRKRRQIAFDYGRKRLQEASPGSLERISGDAIETNFIAIQDYLNFYDREVLAPIDVLTETYDSIPLNHPYYSMRREFILSVIRDMCR